MKLSDRTVELVIQALLKPYTLSSEEALAVQELQAMRKEPTYYLRADKVIEVIEAEPEMPGEIPAELFHTLKAADEETMAEALRIIVRETKKGIALRVRGI